MLVHIHKNILDKVYLVDVVNEFVDGRDSCKLREFIERIPSTKIPIA